MNIIEASKALLEGKKIRRRDYPVGLYYYNSHKEVYPLAYGSVKEANHTTTSPSHEFTIEELLANDWEIDESYLPMERCWNEFRKYHAQDVRSYSYQEIKFAMEYGWKKAMLQVAGR